MRLTGAIKILIVDDSAMVRSMLTRVLSGEKDMRVVGGAAHAYEARELIIRFRPDVIILDIEMPRMDGLTFLKKLQVHYPVPVIMCSGVAPSNSSAALEAIECGAVDVVAKPTRGGNKALQRLGEDLAEKIRAAAIAMPTAPPRPKVAADAPTSLRGAGLNPGNTLVAIGASTGGTEAIKQLLSNVPPDFPPTAIVQHMPEGFTRSFAERLNQFSAMTVTEAVDGDTLEVGHAFVARGEIQMRIAPSGGRWRIIYGSTDTVNRHCPSVEVLFESVAKHAGSHAVGVILTGMGGDGAKGLLTLKKAGAVTIAQDKSSCVVYGMPKVAVELGAVQQSGPPAAIPQMILQTLKNRANARCSTSTTASR